MLYLILGILLFVLMLAPSLWIQYVLHKHSPEMEDMPGTGGELAKHLIERFDLGGVSVKEGKPNEDHYNHSTKEVSLSPRVYQGKSLTAVAVAAHEVGHAIQFNREEPVSRLRDKYLGKALVIKYLGSIFLTAIPIIGLLFKAPPLMLMTAIVGIITMLASVLMYVAILPEEYDASFNKALPILAEGYVPEQHIPAVRQVLRAAAMTYVAAALADILRLWRWFRLIR